MKIKYLLASVVLSASVMVSCGDEKAESTESEPKKETTEEVVAEEENVIIEEDSYSDESVQGQWNDIVAQVNSGEKENLTMYLDISAKSFSQENWDYIDFTQPEYVAAFNAYSGFNDLPDATNKAEGTKVVQVNFQYTDEGQEYESATMIYLVEEDGLIWINGCEMAG